MAQYYFDLRDGDELVVDEEGMELSHVEAVQEEAARSLGRFAWDAVRKLNGSQSYQMAIEVRDQIGPLMTVTFGFEMTRKQ